MIVSKKMKNNQFSHYYAFIILISWGGGVTLNTFFQEAYINGIFSEKLLSVFLCFHIWGRTCLRYHSLLVHIHIIQLLCHLVSRRRILCSALFFNVTIYEPFLPTYSERLISIARIPPCSFFSCLSIYLSLSLSFSLSLSLSLSLSVSLSLSLTFWKSLHSFSSSLFILICQFQSHTFCSSSNVHQNSGTSFFIFLQCFSCLLPRSSN